jgi:hypothetical protein
MNFPFLLCTFKINKIVEIDESEKKHNSSKRIEILDLKAHLNFYWTPIFTLRIFNWMLFTYKLARFFISPVNLCSRRLHNDHLSKFNDVNCQLRHQSTCLDFGVIIDAHATHSSCSLM